jgi:hypothetical protein
MSSQLVTIEFRISDPEKIGFVSCGLSLDEVQRVFAENQLKNCKVIDANQPCVAGEFADEVNPFSRAPGLVSTLHLWYGVAVCATHACRHSIVFRRRRRFRIVTLRAVLDFYNKKNFLSFFPVGSSARVVCMCACTLAPMQDDASISAVGDD